MHRPAFPFSSSSEEWSGQSWFAASNICCTLAPEMSHWWENLCVYLRDSLRLNVKQKPGIALIFYSGNRKLTNPLFVFHGSVPSSVVLMWLLGNVCLQVGRRTWLCVFDPKNDGCSDMKDSQKFKEFLQDKYEKKKWWEFGLRLHITQIIIYADGSREKHLNFYWVHLFSLNQFFRFKKAQQMFKFAC